MDTERKEELKCKDESKGLYMEKQVFNDWEIKIMMDAVQQAKCVSVNESISIMEKLLSLTSNRGRNRFSHIMNPVITNAKVEEEVGNYIETMLEAMFLHKKIEFQSTEITNDMKKVLECNGKMYKFNLYTIYWSNNKYYLIGAHDNQDGLTHYRLDKITNLHISDEYAIDAKDKMGINPELSIQHYIEVNVNCFSGELVQVILEYEANPVTNTILYDFAGKYTKVIKENNGTYTATFTKANSVALTGWLLQYADRFTVIEPVALRDKIKKELQEALHKYDI